MNNKYLKKDITAVVVDEHGYPKTTSYDEEAVELENRVEVIDKETVKVKKELEFALNHQASNWKNILGFIVMFLGAGIVMTSLFLSVFSLTLCNFERLLLLIRIALLGVIICIPGAFYVDLREPFYTKKQIEKIKAKLEVAEEMKEERQRELEEYLKNMKALEPVLEETVIDLSGEYQIDIENVREELEREAISRTRKREKRGR